MHQFLKTTYSQDMSLFANRNAVVSYGLLIVVLLVRPGGILGKAVVEKV